MKIFIDSADIDEIKQVFSWNIADGVTTNPSLMKKAVEKRQGQQLDLDKYIREILYIAKGTPVSLEVTETTAQGMIAQGKALYNKYNPVAKNVTIKIPVNPAFKEEDTTHFEGIEAIRALVQAGIPVNCTLVFTPEQALLAAKAGAAIVSPFAGRVDDFIRKNNAIPFEQADYYPVGGMEKKNQLLHDNGIVSGIHLVAQCISILRRYNLKTEVLAASLRNTRQVREAALAGADIATIPFGVIQDMLKHHKTYEGMKRFIADIVPDYVQLTK